MSDLTPKQAANFFEIQELQNQIRQIPWTTRQPRGLLNRKKLAKLRKKDKASKLARRRNR